MADLAQLLPALMPRAIAWAQARSAELAAIGRPLSAHETAIAHAVGVQQAGKVRVATLAAQPLPADPQLRTVAIQAGLLGPEMIGLTLGHSIYIRAGHESARLLAHELRHVQQYEAAGSIQAFLPLYLGQIIQHGYHDAPLEQDARAHEGAA